MGNNSKTAPVAYFSMEFAIDPRMPTYSGGLGILAGDTIRTFADLGIPALGVTLLHRKGYFRQRLDAHGNQSESDAQWAPQEFLELLAPRVMVPVAGRQVQVQAWRAMVCGESGYKVPVYFLDTALPENSQWEQTFTDHLYGGDNYYRLCQQVVLGLGGLAMLRALGYQNVQAYHMNEGHSALLVLALVEEGAWGRGLHTVTGADIEAVRQRCVFTTHTPLPAGHDRFHLDTVRQILGKERADFLLSVNCCPEGHLNMTHLALNFSRYVNGVSMRHEEISRTMFTNHQVNSITNGVHALTWTAEPFCALYDQHIPEWRRDKQYLRYAIKIPSEEIWEAHREAKKTLLKEIKQRTGVSLDQGKMLIGFARRATHYKRTDFLFQDIKRLKRIARKAGPIQIVCGGKAHPKDEGGKDLIRRIVRAAAELQGDVPVLYLEEYDMSLAKYLCSGVDLWLNTPQKPYEASGTSGMKAALNGVPSLSILDGWWIEGHIEGVTGWSIGDGWQAEPDAETELSSLYQKLERVIVPMYYKRRRDFVNIMRSAIAFNGSYFNSQRMVTQYVQNAYLRAGIR